METNIPASVVSKVETQERHAIRSILKARRLKTQEKMMFQFKSKGRKRPMSRLEGNQGEGTQNTNTQNAKY